MQDGIYHAQFASQQGIAGEGLAVIKSGSDLAPGFRIP